MKVRLQAGWFGPNQVYYDPNLGFRNIVEIPDELYDQLPSSAEIVPEAEVGEESPADELEVELEKQANALAGKEKLRAAENEEAKRQNAKARAARAKG